jgi:hypothetical protein
MSSNNNRGTQDAKVRGRSLPGGGLPNCRDVIASLFAGCDLIVSPESAEIVGHGQCLTLPHSIAIPEKPRNDLPAIIYERLLDLFLHRVR